MKMDELNAAARQSATQTAAPAAGPESDELRRPVPGGYDRRALAVGRAVQQATGAAPVILFGSRARGDYREDSDIDLLLVHPGWKDMELRDIGRKAADTGIESCYGSQRWGELQSDEPVLADLVWFAPEEFEHCRLSINSVVALAAEQGLMMNGQPASEEYPNGDYSEEWTTTEQRCRHTRLHLRTLRLVIDGNTGLIMVGQQAHQAVEHAIKALISANGIRYPHHHNLVDLEIRMRQVDRSFTIPLQSPLKALNDYSGRLKYNEPYADLGDWETLYGIILNDVRQIFARVAHLTGQDPWAEPADAAAQ